MKFQYGLNIVWYYGIIIISLVIVLNEKYPSYENKA